MAQESRLQNAENATAAIEFDSEEIDTVFVEINSLREESQQITELLKLEEYYSREVIEQLRQVMMPQKTSIHINPVTVSKDNSSIADAVLTPDGIVCLMDNRGKVLHRRPLGEFQGETFLNIIDEILPEVKNLVNALQEKPVERLSAIQKISMELRKIVYGEATERTNKLRVLNEGVALHEQS